MSLRPHSGVPPVPEDAARVAKAASPRGDLYLLLRERLGATFRDDDFADLYPALGHSAYAPWRLASVTLLQFPQGAGRPAGGRGDPRADRLETPARA